MLICQACSSTAFIGPFETKIVPSPNPLHPNAPWGAAVLSLCYQWAAKQRLMEAANGEAAN
jgi:hypothetical protein